MNQILEKLALDLINFNKIDERKNKNKKKEIILCTLALKYL